MLRHPGIVFLLSAILTGPASAQELVESPPVVLGDVPFSLTIRGTSVGAAAWRLLDAHGEPLGSGTVQPGQAVTLSEVRVTSATQLPLRVTVGDNVETLAPTLVPGWFSLLPPLVAIVLALIFREVITALFAGVWLGALAVAGFHPVEATWRLVDTFVVPALGDVASGHTQVVVFTLLLGGMVGIVSRNGGTAGVVAAVAPLARSRRRGKIATFIAGTAVFFDDYANCLIVGNTMRPVTDRLRISREKMAYLVDSTAAPVAALVPISTWVGYEMSLIADGLRIAVEQAPTAAEALAGASPFTVFIETIPYRFYPLLALLFVVMTSVMNRDWGPMARAELRAARGAGLYRPGAQLTTDTETGVLDAHSGVPQRWWNAALPLLIVVAVVLGGLYMTGRSGAGPDASLIDVFGAADPFATLLWGSLAGCVAAGVLTVGQRLLSLRDTIESWLAGMRAMMIAVVVLVLAWSLGSVTELVGTAAYLTQILEGNVALPLLPWLVFVVAAAMSFATGTSWGTMAILLPLVIPLAVSLGGGAGFEGGSQYTILLGTISSVLAGGIFGDHCSPISDTTVLSSTATACDHVDHVRTQLPYALLVAVPAMVFGDIGTAYGLPVWASFAIVVPILWIYLRIRGIKIPEATAKLPEATPSPI